MTNKRIAVFCSSSNSLPAQYYPIARQLGQLIGQQHNTLVYGGTDVGLMKEVAEGAKSENGRVIGVIPELIVEMGVASQECDELHRVADMSARKVRISELSDAFVALPGGFGTIEELSEVLTAKYLRAHNKPIVLLNTNGFFDLLIDWFEKLYTEQFAHPSYRQAYYVAKTPQEAIEYIIQYKNSKSAQKY